MRKKSFSINSFIDMRDFKEMLERSIITDEQFLAAFDLVDKIKEYHDFQLGSNLTDEQFFSK